MSEQLPASGDANDLIPESIGASRRAFLASGAAGLVASAAYGAIVLGMDTSNVDTVFVGGRVKKWKGQLVGASVDQLRVRAEQSRDSVLAQARWPRTVLGGYLPGH